MPLPEVDVIIIWCVIGAILLSIAITCCVKRNAVPFFHRSFHLSSSSSAVATATEVKEEGVVEVDAMVV